MKEFKNGSSSCVYGFFSVIYKNQSPFLLGNNFGVKKNIYYYTFPYHILFVS